MRKEKFILLSVLLISLIGCDYYDDRLVINNKKSTNIYVYFSKDTTISIIENKTFIISDYFIKSNNKRNIIKMGSKSAWEFLINSSISNQLHVFVFSEDTLKKYDSNTIIKLKKYEDRIDVNFSELVYMNWEIVYE